MSNTTANNDPSTVSNHLANKFEGEPSRSKHHLNSNEFNQQAQVLSNVHNSIVINCPEIQEQRIRMHQRNQTDHDHSTDVFQPHFQKLWFSPAAKPDIQSTDENGYHTTTEGKVIDKLLQSSPIHGRTISIQGSGGVGKTTVLHLLSHQSELYHHFIHGIYHIKLGAQATSETVITQLANIVQNSGGASLATKILSFQNFEQVADAACKWLSTKSYLLLVDDVWEHNQVGTSILSHLRKMIVQGNHAAMVFTTRDPEIASVNTHLVLQLKPREPQGILSRQILLRHYEY